MEKVTTISVAKRKWVYIIRIPVKIEALTNDLLLQEMKIFYLMFLSLFELDFVSTKVQASETGNLFVEQR